MGGCHSADSLFMKMGKDRNGKGSTLCRICTCTKLIEKDKRVTVGFFQERNHVGHM